MPCVALYHLNSQQSSVHFGLVLALILLSVNNSFVSQAAHLSVYVMAEIIWIMHYVNTIFEEHLLSEVLCLVFVHWY